MTCGSTIEFAEAAQLFDGKKTIKLKAFGTEIELTPEEVKIAMNELLPEISDPTNELKEADVELFESIVASEGRKSVIELAPTFVRGNAVHDTLRLFRDRHLIRPIEGSRWLPEKHPVLTRFGRLINDLKGKGMPRQTPNPSIKRTCLQQSA